MPIRRISEGKFEKESVRPRTQETSGRYRTGTRNVPEDLTGGRGKLREDSLFRPAGPENESGSGLDEPTEVMEGRGMAEDEKTRIVRPRRRTGGVDAESIEDRDDPMRDPPVGWLVIVAGPGKGHVLTVGNGMNSIGRGDSARVRINYGDATIARSNHARIAYEPRNRRYLLSHGEGSNLTYVDGEVVMESREIESGAMIELGATKLRFQAFCSKEFDWHDVDD